MVGNLKFIVLQLSGENLIDLQKLVNETII
jgi:hypothetical protein